MWLRLGGPAVRGAVSPGLSPPAQMDGRAACDAARAERPQRATAVGRPDVEGFEVGDNDASSAHTSAAGGPFTLYLRAAALDIQGLC